METKKQIRAAVLKKRTELPVFDVEEKSRKITKTVVGHPWFREAGQVLAYIDFRKEVSTRLLIERCWEQGKNVYAPKVEGATMQFYRIQSWDDVREGAWKILEPRPGLPVFQDTESGGGKLAIMPGVAFDGKRNRIGYGGGYYDRYFEKCRSMRKIAIAFECQIVEEIASETTDIRPDYIITESRIIR